MHLATSLTADLQLIAAVLVWAYAVHVSFQGYSPDITMIMVSMSGGALLANLASVLLLMAENVSFLQRYPGSTAPRSRDADAQPRRT